jgi:hypothetical protein
LQDSKTGISARGRGDQVVKWYSVGMSDEEARKQRAIECVTKYRETLRSPERIAAFAVWFAERWKDARKEPPTDMMLVLLKDSKLNVVHLGYRTSGGGWSVTDEPRLSTIYVQAHRWSSNSCTAFRDSVRNTRS